MSSNFPAGATTGSTTPVPVKVRWFNSIENLNWTRLWYIEGIFLAFWGGMSWVATMFPKTAKYYMAVNGLLGALALALTFAARGTKYVTNRQEPPVDGKP